MLTLLVAAALLAGCGIGAPSTGDGEAVARGGLLARQAADECIECVGGGAAESVDGPAMEEGDTQLVRIAVVDGQYKPNLIELSAGRPVKVVFEGKAKGCLAKPTFGSLGKTARLTSTGRAELDLGALAPGTYGFGCANGRNRGSLVVR